MGRMVLTVSDALLIKAKLWNGARQKDIANMYFISRSLISQISTGDAYYDVQWPNGSAGELPAWRVLEIQKMKFKGNRAREVQETLSARDELRDQLIEKHVAAAIERDIAEPQLEYDSIVKEITAEFHANANNENQSEEDIETEIAMIRAQKAKTQIKLNRPYEPGMTEEDLTRILQEQLDQQQADPTPEEERAALTLAQSNPTSARTRKSRK